MTNKELNSLIFPKPKRAEVTGGDVALTHCRLDVQAGEATSAAAQQLLEKKLSAVGVCVCEDAAFVITLRLGAAPAGAKIPAHSYTINISAGGISMVAGGEQGLYYAAVSLTQLLTSATLPCAVVEDWPDLDYRAQKIECRFGSDVMEKQDWFDAVDILANQKISHLNIAVYGCWVVQYDGRVSEYLYVPLQGYDKLKTPRMQKYYDPAKKEWVCFDKLPPMFEHDFFGEVVAYGRARGIMVFPGFNSYGHSTLIPDKYPEVSPLDEQGEPTLTGYCTSNPKSYEMLFDIYDQIIDRYLTPNGVDTFDIIMDEVWAEIAQNAKDIYRRRSPWCKCPECSKLDPGQMFINHAIRLIKHLKEKGMKRILFCCDMLIDHGPNGVGVLTKPLLEALKREDLMNDVMVVWWTYADLWEKLMFHTTQPETGLRRAPSPWNGYYAWCCQCNSTRDIYMLAKMGYEEKAEGFHAYSSWDQCQDRNNHLFAEYGWGFSGAGEIQDVTDRYLCRNFPTHMEEARRAFQLFDFITEERIDQPEGDSSCLANYFMLRDRLSYYFYSYVEDNKPYPRNFPGEAMQKICARRTDHIRAMLGISAMAQEAKAIWEAIAADPACNQDQAKRYAYEADNYKVLVDDYLAMLRMMELNEEQDYALIKKMALARRDTRVALMLRLQDTKEPYLQSFQLRNHSIFMQFFQDLYDYLDKTPADEVKLDFFDLRNFASERFYWLR